MIFLFWKLLNDHFMILVHCDSNYPSCRFYKLPSIHINVQTGHNEWNTNKKNILILMQCLNIFWGVLLSHFKFSITNTYTLSINNRTENFIKDLKIIWRAIVNCNFYHVTEARPCHFLWNCCPTRSKTRL